MRTTLRIAAPLVVSLALASFAFAVYQVQTERRTLRADLAQRVNTLTMDLQRSIEPFAGTAEGNLSRLLDRFSQRDHVKNVAVYDATGAMIDAAPDQELNISALPAIVERAARLNAGVGEFLVVNDAPLYVYAAPLHRNDEVTGTLAVVNDAADIESR